LEILRLYAESYCRFSARLGMAGIQLTIRTDAPEFMAGVESELVEHLRQMQPECEQIGLEATADLIGSTLDRWDAYKNRDLLSRHCTEILVCLENELKRRVCFTLPRSAEKLFRNPAHGWEEILEVFPDARGDIEEMNYCLVFDRHAGAVFHVLLAVEYGVIDLGKFIGVSDPKAGWDATCRLLEKTLEAGQSCTPDKLKKHFAFLELVNRDVQSMKLAWRNKVNHAAGKLTVMTSDFQPRVAEKIILACQGFMLLLATEGPRAK
jgi:hypothetical protein